MALLVLAPLLVTSFTAPPTSHHLPIRAAAIVMQEREPFALKLDLPPRGTCNLKFKPVFPASEAVVVKYGLPFNLNVESKNGLCTVTKPGAGGEAPGDILRYCTTWTLGLPGGAASPGATIASFSGAGLSYRLGLFDVCKEAKKWDDVVEALTSNTPERTDQVTLVFERPA